MATDGAEAAGRGRLRGEPGGAPPPHPPLEATGSDVTHQPNPLAPPTRVDPRSGLLCRCLPGGPPPEPRSDWAPPQDPPRQGDPWRESGRPTAAPQRLRLLNTLTGQEHVIEARGAQAGGLLRQALPWNAHAGGYAWRCGGAPLHPEGPPPRPLPDGSPPTVLLYFTDDFGEQ